MMARVPCLMLAQEIIFSQCECQPGLDASNYKHVFIEQLVSHAVTIVGIARSGDQSHPFQVPALQLWHSRLWRQNWNFQLACVVGLQLGGTKEEEDVGRRVCVFKNNGERIWLIRYKSLAPCKTLVMAKCP